MTRKRISRQSIREHSRKQRENERLQRQALQNRVIVVVAGALIVVVLVLIARQLLGKRPLASVPPMERNGHYTAYPEMVIDSQRQYTAVLRTEKGDIRIRLFADEAPLTVNNFVFLARQGFYDGTTFHRVISDFMAQGGDPTGLGTGGPGYTFADETDNGLLFDRPGLLAMANRGPDTNSSQFFITYVETPHLNGLHTIFGEVESGQAVLDSLTRLEADPSAGIPQGDVIDRIDIIQS